MNVPLETPDFIKYTSQVPLHIQPVLAFHSPGRLTATSVHMSSYPCSSRDGAVFYPDFENEVV
jgi:hypothetical protein